MATGRNILVLENIGQLEERFFTFLDTYQDDPIDIQYQIGRLSKEELIDKLTTPGLTDLMLESTFANRKQLLGLVYLLNTYSDQISFKKISVLFSLHEFEVFLNRLVLEAPEFKDLLTELFSKYKILSIEFEQFQEVVKKDSYFKKYHYFYQVVEMELEDGVFQLEHFPVIDPRSKNRSHSLVSVDKKIAGGVLVQDFFNGVETFLNYKKNVEIEFDNEEEQEKNDRRIIILNYFKALMDSAK